jgi:hypothetical protein
MFRASDNPQGSEYTVTRYQSLRRFLSRQDGSLIALIPATHLFVPDKSLVQIEAPSTIHSIGISPKKLLLEQVPTSFVEPRTEQPGSGSRTTAPSSRFTLDQGMDVMTASLFEILLDDRNDISCWIIVGYITAGTWQIASCWSYGSSTSYNWARSKKELTEASCTCTQAGCHRIRYA